MWDYGKGISLKGYTSPGHNSVYYDEENNHYVIIFHTRFPGLGERNEVRVHSLLFNEEGWPVIAPRRYAGEHVEEIALGDIQGDYMVIEDQNDIVADRILSQDVEVEGSAVRGAFDGNIELGENGQATIKWNDEVISGQFLPQWDDYANKQTITFTGLDQNGTAIMMVKK